MAGNIIVRFVLFPFQLLMRLFSVLLRPFRSAGRSSTTLRKAAAGPASGVSGDMADMTADEAAPADEETSAADVQNGAERNPRNFFFKSLPRPRLVERSAADLTLDGAKSYIRQSHNFYRREFPLFHGGNLFYEEVEAAYLTSALGVDLGSIDSRFVEIIAAFRRGLNDNTRLLFLVYAPLIFMGFLIGATVLLQNPAPAALADFAAAALPAQLASPFIDVITLAPPFIAALITLLVIYKWPYEVTQTQNLLGLDNYITNKFARVNHNFQVAKRKALNVEREKRFSQMDALKDEAGTWTRAYHWLATRLFLCETLIRNMVFQVRRNTALYVLGSQVISIALAALVAGAFWFGVTHEDARAALYENAGVLVGASALYLLIAYGVVMRQAFRVVHSVLEQNEWSRFYAVNLPQSIADHVGEDKVQIVTFRDRNRVEG
ncbi:MAG: hypothetical protein AAGC95_09085 [Pseudomonadota bacterium]